MIMKFLSAMIMTILFIGYPYLWVNANESIPSIKAPFHVGETLMVCGNVAKVAYLNKRIVLNIGQTYPNEDISFLIWDSDVAGFAQRFGRLDSLENHRVCAVGTIETYKNHLQIVLKNSKMLRLMK